MSAIIDFQLARKGDAQGRFIHDIWQLEPFWLEHDHKYIQWLFPIDSQSKFNMHAPMLTEIDRYEFQSSVELRDALKSSLMVMLHFFGMKWVGGQMLPSDDLNMRQFKWLKRAGHNHYRISRIIRSLGLCSQGELSLQFYQAMLATAEEYGQVSEESKMHWLSSLVTNSDQL